MKKESVDFLRTLADEAETEIEKVAPKKWRRFFALNHIGAILIACVLVVGLTYTTRVVISGDKIAEQFGNSSVIEQIKHLVGSDNKPLNGEEVGRINVLLLGIGGEAHEGGQLTDTIMLASLNPATGQASLLSIPRDLVVPIEGVGWQKINAAHAYGSSWYPDDPAQAAALAVHTVETLTQQNIQYYVKLDFGGFTKIVDSLGGVRVYVPTEFTDYQYPDNANGYDPVHFDSGWQNLDGARALKYARSRHGTNNQGSDFARARRQQDLLRSLQQRVLALSTLLNPNKLITLAEIVGDHIKTNMEIWELVRFYELIQSIDGSAINQMVLSTESQGLLVSEQSEDGAYILRPRKGASNFSEIQLLAQHMLDRDPYAALAAPPIPAKPSIKVVVQNGTTYPGLAALTAQELAGFDYAVIEVSNATRRDYERTVIYTINTETDPSEIQDLKEKLHANIAPSIPQYIEQPDADILIILGEDRIPEHTLSLAE